MAQAVPTIEGIDLENDAHAVRRMRTNFTDALAVIPVRVTPA